jgi:hypothetical protein
MHHLAGSSYRFQQHRQSRKFILGADDWTYQLGISRLLKG